MPVVWVSWGLGPSHVHGVNASVGRWLAWWFGPGVLRLVGFFKFGTGFGDLLASSTPAHQDEGHAPQQGQRRGTINPLCDSPRLGGSRRPTWQRTLRVSRSAPSYFCATSCSEGVLFVAAAAAGGTNARPPDLTSCRPPLTTLTAGTGSHVRVGVRSPKMSPVTVRECRHDDCTTLGCSTFLLW